MEIWIAIVAVGLLLAWRMKPVKGINSITTAELKSLINDKNKVFIDVRTAGEYKARNIRQFRNIPLGSDYSSLPKDKEIVVICQSGMRSMQACKQLKKLGYEKISNVHGGMSAY